VRKQEPYLAVADLAPELLLDQNFEVRLVVHDKNCRAHALSSQAGISIIGNADQSKDAGERTLRPRNVFDQAADDVSRFAIGSRHNLGRKTKNEMRHYSRSVLPHEADDDRIGICSGD
jgi:hypothetical protein